MGSLDPTVGIPTEDVHVLVTGYGPFGNRTSNASFLIANALPTLLTTPQYRIHLHVHPTPLPVSYSAVRSIVPPLLFPPLSQKPPSSTTPSISWSPPSAIVPTTNSSRPHFDIILHIGMAPGRHYFTLETQAHRSGYKTPDVDGVTFEHDTYFQDKFHSPEILTTSFDTADVWRRWKSVLTDEDIRPSNDAGHYLCDFVYYTSLVEYWRRDSEGKRPVVFLHTPGETGGKDLERGVRVAVGLVGALVDCWVKGRGGGNEEGRSS